jgi:hypothetical protein
MHIQPAFLPRIHILNALGHYYNSLYDYTYFNLHSVETPYYQLHISMYTQQNDIDISMYTYFKCFAPVV